MADAASHPLNSPGLRAQTPEQLEEFLERPDAAEIVRDSSFEQVFFSVKALGLADSLDLLPLVTERQIRGFLDLDCWRKDSFARRPFMEWIAAFVQGGAEEMARALSSADAELVALFLKDLIAVYEVEQDEPPPAIQLTYTPDNALAVEQLGTGDQATMAVLILDALFRYEPALGYHILRKVRYTTATELEETAYQNKVRRLDVHGFVDYYEALSIYAEPPPSNPPVRPRPGADPEDEVIAAQESPGGLPAVFADSLSEGRFLMAAIGGLPESETGRVGEELTALGNRVLSANLVNLGEVEGIRSALGEMRDFLTIGLEELSGGDVHAASASLGANHVQAVFHAGFAVVARLGREAEQVARISHFHAELLESPDLEFFSGLVRSKPLLWDEGAYRNFRSVREIDQARERLGGLRTMVEGLLGLFGPIDTTLKVAFSTALVQKAISGRFHPDPIDSGLFQEFVTVGVEFPEVAASEALDRVLGHWIDDLREDIRRLNPSAIDPRFVGFVKLQPRR